MVWFLYRCCGLTCFPEFRDNCKEPVGCQYGTSSDACGYCTVCSKVCSI